MIKSIKYGILTLVIMVASGPCNAEESQYTVAEFKRHYLPVINNRLKDKENFFGNIMSRVDQAHKTVTVRDAYFSKCEITTKNGSNIAGKGGCNIKKIDYEITVIWDGYFKKFGKTILAICQENIPGAGIHVTKADIVYTDAWINVEDGEKWKAAKAEFIEVVKYSIETAIRLKGN